MLSWSPCTKRKYILPTVNNLFRRYACVSIGHVWSVISGCCKNGRSFVLTASWWSLVSSECRNNPSTRVSDKIVMCIIYNNLWCIASFNRKLLPIYHFCLFSRACTVLSNIVAYSCFAPWFIFLLCGTQEDLEKLKLRIFKLATDIPGMHYIHFFNFQEISHLTILYISE